MAIKSLVVFLGVTAMLWCMTDADVTTSNCVDNPAISVTSLTVSSGYLPLGGGQRTIGGSLNVNVGSSQVSQVNVKVNYARASVSFLTIDLCNRDELSEYCTSSGRVTTCSEFAQLLDVSDLCNNGNFQNRDLTMTDQSVTVPSVSSVSLSGTVSAQVQFISGDTVVGCTTISIPVHN